MIYAPNTNEYVSIYPHNQTNNESLQWLLSSDGPMQILHVLNIRLMLINGS